MESLYSINWKFIFFLGFIGGLFWGYYISHMYFKGCFKRFRDEMNDQYISLLKQHGIQLKKEE